MKYITLRQIEKGHSGYIVFPNNSAIIVRALNEPMTTENFTQQLKEKMDGTDKVPVLVTLAIGATEYQQGQHISLNGNTILLA